MKYCSLLLCFLLCAIACGQNDDKATTDAEQEMQIEMDDDESSEAEEESESEEAAFVESVTISGDEDAYTFNVTLKSPDTGCDQYADWWEVLSLDGELLYRRILGHSHVNEQPFTRSGGPVAINAREEVYVRLHMNNTGYSSRGLKGSKNMAFVEKTFNSDFAEELETAAPLPDGCAF